MTAAAAKVVSMPDTLMAKAKTCDVYALFSAAVLWVYQLANERIRCLHFEHEVKGATTLVATNGHGVWICDAFPFEHAVFSTFNIKLDDARAILRVISQRRPPSQRRQRRPVPPDEFVEFHSSDSGVVAKIGRYQLALAPCEVEFPSWKQIVAQTDNSASSTGHQVISVEKLSLVVRSLPGRHGVPHEAIKITNKGRMEATRFDGTVGEHKARLYIMPLRDG